MPFAKNGEISQALIEGGIEITEQQYQEGLAGILAGQVISIDNGFAVLDPPTSPPEEPEPPIELDAREKLAAFLRNNPDVLELLK